MPALQRGAASSSDSATASNEAARFRSRRGRAALIVSARIAFVRTAAGSSRHENRAAALKGELSASFCDRLAAGGVAALRILLVEDDDMLGDAVREALHQEG